MTILRRGARLSIDAGFTLGPFCRRDPNGGKHSLLGTFTSLGCFQLPHEACPTRPARAGTRPPAASGGSPRAAAALPFPGHVWPVPAAWHRTTAATHPAGCKTDEWAG